MFSMLSDWIEKLNLIKYLAKMAEEVITFDNNNLLLYNCFVFIIKRRSAHYKFKLCLLSKP